MVKLIKKIPKKPSDKILFLFISHVTTVYDMTSLVSSQLMHGLLLCLLFENACCGLATFVKKKMKIAYLLERISAFGCLPKKMS